MLRTSTGRTLIGSISACPVFVWFPEYHFIIRDYLRSFAGDSLGKTATVGEDASLLIVSIGKRAEA